jgi:hypothetical protein
MHLLMIVGLLAATATPAPAGPGHAEDAPSVTCRVPADPAERVYRLHREGDVWLLTFLSRETRGQAIRLELPRAAPAITAGSVTLSYRNANGGRQVELRATTNTSSLDVWVDYGLDVNIDLDLDPRVDLMNTKGPLADVRCVIEPRSAP